MKQILLTFCFAALAGCQFAPGCYVGVSLFPPGPFVHCGLDASPEDETEDGAE